MSKQTDHVLSRDGRTIAMDAPIEPAAITYLHSLMEDLVHDLRQPLSTIVTCASYIGLIVSADDERVHEQLDLIERQVEHTNHILVEALQVFGSRAAQCRTESALAADSRPFTNKAMAAGTY